MGELTPQQKFQDRIADRLREDIGDLLPDEVLAEMVERAINEMFFKKRVDNSGYQATQKPSWFEELVADELTAQIKATLANYFASNHAEIHSAIKECINDSLADLLAKAVSQSFVGAGFAIGQSAGYDMANGFTIALRSNGLIQ